MSLHIEFFGNIQLHKGLNNTHKLTLPAVGLHERRKVKFSGRRVANKNNKINSVLERGLVLIDETPLKIESANIQKNYFLILKHTKRKLKKINNFIMNLIVIL